MPLRLDLTNILGRAAKSCLDLGEDFPTLLARQPTAHNANAMIGKSNANAHDWQI